MPFGPMLNPSRSPFEPFWGHVEELTLETLSPVASEVASLSLRNMFFSKTLLLTVYVVPSSGYVGPSGFYVGAMFAHLVAMLGPCWPPGGDFGAMLFSWLIPKFCLKTPSPVACEAPTPFLQHHFSEKAESCPGRAHPRWAPEGSHQWPARFQEKPPEGSAVAAAISKARFASATAQPDSWRFASTAACTAGFWIHGLSREICQKVDVVWFEKLQSLWWSSQLGDSNVHLEATAVLLAVQDFNYCFTIFQTKVEVIPKSELNIWNEPQAPSPSTFVFAVWIQKTVCKQTTSVVFHCWIESCLCR